LVIQNMDAVTRRLQEIWLVVLRRERGFFEGGGGWLFAVGESWDGEEEGEIGEERVDREGIY
jgi:hypothetical protein